MSRHAAPRTRLGWVRVRALLGLGLALALGTGGTFAHWTDSVEIGGTTLTSGTIDLRVDDQDTVTGYATLDLAAMVPGNSAAAVLTVKNSGTAPVKYTAATAATNADGKGLAAALTVRVTGDGTVTGTAPARTCGGSVLAGTGSALGAGLVTTGRLLAAGASETLCVEVTLPSGAAPSLQGGTTDVTVTFTGTSDLS